MSKVPSSQQTRRKLLVAASQEIVESGYAGSSLANIAARIGYTKGSLCYHFPTKETILDGLMKELAASEQRAAIRAQQAFPDRPSRALLAHIAAYAFLAATDAPTSAGGILARDPSIPPSYGRKLFLLWERVLTEHLQRAVDLEGYELTMPPQEAARHLISTTAGAYLTSQFADITGSRPRMEHIAPALVSIGLDDAEQLEQDVRDAGFFFSLDAVS